MTVRLSCITPMFEDYAMIKRISTTVDNNGLYCNDDGSTFTSPYACVYKLNNKYQALVHVPKDIQTQLLTFKDIRDAYEHGFIPNYMLLENAANSSFMLGTFDDELVAAYVAQKIRYDGDNSLRLFYQLFKEKYLNDTSTNTINEVLSSLPDFKYDKINSLDECNKIDKKYRRQIMEKYKIQIDQQQEIKQQKKLISARIQTLIDKVLTPIYNELKVSNADKITDSIISNKKFLDEQHFLNCKLYLASKKDPIAIENIKQHILSFSL